MKFRHGFVSNSSSTSFIIRADQKEQALSQGLTLINVGEIRSILDQIAALEDKLESHDVDFIFGYITHRVTHFKGLKDEDFISTPFDRDQAYTLNFTYPAFMGDL